MKSLHLDVSEATANTVIGIAISIATALWVFPLMGIPTTLPSALGITAFYFVTSTVRSFLLRRLFRWLESPHHDTALRLRATWHLLYRVPRNCWTHRRACGRGGRWPNPAFLVFSFNALRNGTKFLWTCDMDQKIFGKSNRDLYTEFVRR